MPWRGPEYPGEFPSLGWGVVELIHAKCRIPDGPHRGDPFLLTEEQQRFIVWHYRIDPDAHLDLDRPSAPFVFRRSQLVRPQKWGKGPLSAAMVCAEGDPEGPVLFDGWGADGEPVGRPWGTPWIQVTAVSEDQTDNVWRSLIPMIELGDFAGSIDDTGQTRINLPGGGLVEPVTASARSRLGQRITFAVQDETHSWIKRNGGHYLSRNQLRNLAGMGGRSIETTNAWDPSEDSVAQRTYESKTSDVHKDYPTPLPVSFANKRERRRIFRVAYGDSRWVDLDRIEAEAAEIMEQDPANAERFFGNRIVTGSDAAFDPVRWGDLAGRPPKTGKRRRLEVITAGFDGARFEDSTGLVATHVATGYQWVAGVWEKPDGVAGDVWEVPEHEVTDALAGLFADWTVWRVYADPPRWESTIDAWIGTYGPDKIIPWWTLRTKAMAWALRNFAVAQTRGELSHDDHPAYAAHIRNSRRIRHPQLRDDEGRPMWTIQKDRPGSPLKIDLAMAGCLSWEARGDAIAAGVLQSKPAKTWRGSL